MNMRNASRTSNTPSDCERTPETVAATKNRRGKREPQWYDCIAPPRPRRRVREARRWRDELYAATTNGLPRNRWPGQRYFMPSETFEIADRAMLELEARDPELYMAVHYVMFWDDMADLGIPLDEWKRRALKRADHLAKIRASMRPREFK